MAIPAFPQWLEIDPKLSYPNEVMSKDPNTVVCARDRHGGCATDRT